MSRIEDNMSGHGLRSLLRMAAFILVMAFTCPAFAATLAGWDVHALTGGSGSFGSSPMAATVADSNLTVGGLTRGSGVGTSGTGAARAWGGNTWNSSGEAAAVSANQFATFTVAANPGHQVSFSNISKLDYRRSATGASTGVLQYQIGTGAFADITTVNYTATASTGGSLAAIDLSGIPALQNVPAGTTVTFRIVNYGGTSTSGTWYIFDYANSTANDLEITGTISDLTPVAGACGSDNGKTLAATAPGNLCSAGAASTIGGSGHPWNWTCAGTNGGSTATCSATIQTYALTFAVDGNGTLSGATAQTIDYGGSASPITAIANGGYSFQSWTGTNGFAASSANPLMVGNVTANHTITANFTAAPISGACGADNGQTLAAKAPANLCSTGAASTVTGSGHPWTWSCGGANGGTTATCSAAIQTYNVVFAADGNGALSGTTSQTIDFGGSTTPVSADATSGYSFVNWTGTNGFTATTANPLVIGNVAANLNIIANFTGTITILHVNDTHARMTPHKWVVTEHGTDQPVFEDVGGAAYLASEMLQLTAVQPNAIVIDAGDISEGNPIGDMNGNGSMTQFYALLSSKLKAQRGRGMDAVVVGNHDVRDINYITNLNTLKNSGVPVISVNVRDVATHQPYFAPYTVVTIGNTKVGILGYTTEAAEVGATLANTLEIADCDWNSADTSKVHLAAYVNELRNNLGCDVVILAAHIGHSGLVDPTEPLLADDGAAKLPEAVVTGHWHTWSDTVWQPAVLNYKTIFTESASYMKYIGELKMTNTGSYVSSSQHVIRNADITPDPDVQSLVASLTAQYDAAHPGHPVDEVIGYTADNLLLDNNMKWWSADEYPWSGNNTAGQWICDAMQWKAEQLFGQCDLAMETGGGVRADIPAGPVTYMQIYETFPWNDDTFYRINMTGQEIVNFLKQTNADAGFSRALDVTAHDGVPSNVKFNGQQIDLAKTYTVAINNYMYAHPPNGWTWSDTAPLTSTVLCRDGIVDYMRQFTSPTNAYQVGGQRYHLNTEFSGGYRAVVTMMNDNDTKPTYEDAFIRFLSATPETLARRGTNQVPSDLVNADGSINATNRLSEQELYRSYLGFKNGVLKPGDIIETWGKGSFYGGNPEFVDQEGIYGDGIEFKIVGHDDSLAKPVFMSSVAAFWDESHKNHYVQFLAKKAGADTATDQFGQTIKVWDATGYASKSLPGSVGDTLLISGVPTMESYGMRFRCDNASTSSTSLPSISGISSHIDPVSAGATGTPLSLSATATVNAGTYLLAPVADAQVASGHATSNYGTSNNLYVQSAASGYGNERAWLKFDLSGIPSNMSITSANLQLWNWKAAGASLPAEVRGGSDDSWTETGITWNSQPAYGSVLASQTLASGTNSLWYTWDITSFAQSKWSGNKLVSLVVKPATENATDTTAPSYGFDAKEYGSNVPVLKVTTQSGAATIAMVQFFYRYSSDNATWGSWTLFATATATPYAATFDYPQGEGYYEFYSRATDGSGNLEPAPAAAQAATHYTDRPAYYPIVSIGNVYQKYDGSAKSVSVATIPTGASYNVTYNGESSEPVSAGIYQVVAMASQGDNTVSTNGTLTIAKAAASVSFGNLSFNYDGTFKPAVVTTTPSGLAVTVTYNGSTTPPTSVGSYAVVAIVNDPNYHGGATGTLTINKATAINISSQVSAINNGFSYSRISKYYVGNLTVTNTGPSPITGTIDVVFNGLTSSMTLVNATGMKDDFPYISKSVSLPPGASVVIPLQFANPANARISFTPVTYLE